MGYSEYQVTRMIGVFLTFLIPVTFFGWLGLSWDFLGYSKQSERKEPWKRVWRNPERIVLRIKYNQTC